MSVNKFDEGKKLKVSKQTVMGTETYTNNVTGELVEMSVINKDITQDVNFHKIWLQDVLNVIDSFGNKKILVLTYLLKNMRNEDNSVSGSYREIAKKCAVSYPTVALVMKELIDSDVVRKLSTATYQFNPSLIAKGSTNKRKNLLIRYNSVEDDGKAIENAKTEDIPFEEVASVFEAGKQITIDDEIKERDIK